MRLRSYHVYDDDYVVACFQNVLLKRVSFSLFAGFHNWQAKSLVGRLLNPQVKYNSGSHFSGLTCSSSLFISIGFSFRCAMLHSRVTRSLQWMDALTSSGSYVSVVGVCRHLHATFPSEWPTNFNSRRVDIHCVNNNSRGESTITKKISYSFFKVL